MYFIIHTVTHLYTHYLPTSLTPTSCHSFFFCPFSCLVASCRAFARVVYNSMRHVNISNSNDRKLQLFCYLSMVSYNFQAGQLLNVVFGADAPRLARTIEQELKNEEQAKKGERERPNRAPHELTPPEQVDKPINLHIY